MIETSPPRSSHMRPHAIEHPLTLFIGVKSVVQKSTQKPPPLRNSEPYRTLDVSLLLQIRHIIAHRRRTEPDHCRVFRRIDHFVNPRRLESRRVFYMRHVSRKFPLAPSDRSR